MAKDRYGKDRAMIERTLKKLSTRLKVHRELKNEVNYDKWAAINDLSRTQIWRYENGQDFYFSSLLKILRALDISLADFFKEGFDDEPKSK
jgi:transcriptional regulator with XRE-family HTH domain